MTKQTETVIKVGVSACLLGHQVRYDGGHKRNSFLIEELGKHVEYVPVCPETAIGLGIPRPTIRLVGDIDNPRVLGVADTGLDVTGRLRDYAESQIDAFQDLSGFVLKKDSPSCGMERVKVYDTKGTHATRKGVGAFARVLMERMPLLPVEEEGRMNDAVLRENFINRVYVYQRWRQLLADGVTAARLIEFHTAHKYMVMAHSQAAYQRMGKLLSNLSRNRLEAITDEYAQELMTTIKRRVNCKRHVNVL